MADMTQPETPTGVALQYVREELSTLRGTVHDELGAMRKDVSTLAGELRAYSSEQGPRIAVLEHRLGEAEKDLITQKAEHDKEIVKLLEGRRGDRTLKWTVATAIIVAVLAWVPPLITLMGR
jgi:hypothetical protein